MRKFLKMGLAICLLLVMLFSLVACSGGRSSDKTGGETESGDISSTDVGNNGDEDVGFGDADDTDSAETDANGMYFLPGFVISQCISSEITITLFLYAISAIFLSVSLSQMFPEGLCGLHSIIRFV